MKKLNYISTQNFPCTCNNHHLIQAGEYCETCMGMVMDSNADISQVSEMESRYDVDYFEALDQWYERMEFAA